MGRGLQAVLTAVVALALALAAFARPVVAAETQVAVAANFAEPAKAIAAAFAADTGHKAVLSFGSSGQLYAQTARGAPYEVFLSADADRPRKAEQEGLGVRGTRFTYAVGRLVLYSKTPGLVDPQGAVLRKGGLSRVAIADPVAAPYGVAAVRTMQKLGVYNALKPKMVMGTSIAQAYQFVSTGAAEVGFVALAQVVDEPGGSRWIVPAADHPPIDQQAILLSAGRKNPAAAAFLKYLRGPKAAAIIQRYGYEAK